METRAEATRAQPTGRPDLDSPEARTRYEVGVLLRSVQAALIDASRDFGHTHGLGRNDARAVVAIMDGQRQGTPIGPTALAKTLGISTASTTVLIDRLEALGHVRRAPAGDDRRRVVLELTDHARVEGVHYFGSLQRRIAAATSQMDQQQLEAVRDYLQAVLGAVHDHLEDPPGRAVDDRVGS